MSLFRKFSNRNEIYQLFRNNYICIVFASWLRHFCYYFSDQNLQRFWQPTLEDLLQAPEIFGLLRDFYDAYYVTIILSQMHHIQQFSNRTGHLYKNKITIENFF